MVEKEDVIVLVLLFILSSWLWLAERWRRGGWQEAGRGRRPAGRWPQDGGGASLDERSGEVAHERLSAGEAVQAGSPPRRSERLDGVAGFDKRRPAAGCLRR